MFIKGREKKKIDKIPVLRIHFFREPDPRSGSTIFESRIQDPDPLFLNKNQRIRIHIKMKWIRNPVSIRPSEFLFPLNQNIINFLGCINKLVKLRINNLNNQFQDTKIRKETWIHTVGCGTKFFYGSGSGSESLVNGKSMSSRRYSFHFISYEVLQVITRNFYRIIHFFSKIRALLKIV